MSQQRVLPQRVGNGAAGQGTLAVDGLAIGIDDPTQPAFGGKGGAVIALEDGLAAEPNT